MNFFNDDKKEYVIKNMFPKRPWFNYSWNEKYISSFSQFGFGISRYRDKAGNLRSILNDSDNRLIFIRDEKSGEYYAANRNYDNKEFEVFETNVGQGYSVIQSEYMGISTSFKLFVPENGFFECWEVVVENKADEERDINLYSYANIDAGITVFDGYTRTDFSNEINGIYSYHYGYKLPTDLIGMFFSSNCKPVAYETSASRFKGEYSDIGHPIALSEKELSSQGSCFDNKPEAVMQFKLNLKGKEQKKILFILGTVTGIDEAKKICDNMLNEDAFNREFESIINKINHFQENIMVKTPDKEINSRVNIWLKRQMELGKQWGRLYGKGFRDIMQDTMAFLPLDVQNARDRILYVSKYMRENGNPIRQWEPFMSEVYTDGAAWLIFTLNAYLKETNDFDILNEKTTYYESSLEETLLEHCFRGMNYLQSNLGEHGLCLWGNGDWNDALNACGILGRGESLWLSQATFKAAYEFADILNRIGMHDEAKSICEKADIMKDNIYKYGWDRDHFIYGINDFGEKVGSYDTEEGQIFLNTQTWAILSGIIDGEAAQNLMEKVEEKLGCPFGYVQQYPCYSKGNERIGRVSYFEKGCYENGSVYNHGVAFKAVADCIVGNGDQALDTILRILPNNPENSYEQSGVEPYAMSNMYFGPENPTRKGDAPQNWITGTSGWLFRCIVENIIGISADYEGLKIEPNLPHCWDKVKVKRVFRGSIYDIEIDNIHSGDNYEIYIDNAHLDGKVLPEFNDGKIHYVQVKKAM